MNLNLSGLERVHHRQGKTIARCPACAEAGHDRRGEHLVINKNGSFGCVIYPGDSTEAKAHRKQIFALCGTREIQPLIVHRNPSLPKTSVGFLTSLASPQSKEASPLGRQYPSQGRQGRFLAYSGFYTRKAQQSEPPARPLLNQSKPESVPSVPTVPPRKLKERTKSLYPCEVDWLDRWCKLGGNPSIILEAVRLFNAKIVRIEQRSRSTK
jgi:hypothetical protein